MIVAPVPLTCLVPHKESRVREGGHTDPLCGNHGYPATCDAQNPPRGGTAARLDWSPASGACGHR